MRRVSPGEPMRPHFTAQWFNSTLDKQVPQPLPRGLSKLVPGPHNEDSAVFVPSVDHPTVARFDPIALTSRADEYGNRVVRVGYVDVDSLNQYNWIVAQVGMGAGFRTGPCVYSGITYANVDILDAAHTHVRLNETTLTLESSYAGKGTILIPGESISLISIGAYVITSWVVKPLTEISAGTNCQLGTGTAQVYTTSATGRLTLTDETITVYNSQPDAVPVGPHRYQAKNWNGLPLIDVVPCGDESDVSCSSGDASA